MRLPESLLAGLMWFDPRRPDALANLRHEAQERDGELLLHMTTASSSCGELDPHKSQQNVRPRL